METQDKAVRDKTAEFLLKVLSGELISLTGLWREAGMSRSKTPVSWLRSTESAEFMAGYLNSARGYVLQSKPDPRRGSKTAIRKWAETVIKECEKEGLIIRLPGRYGAIYATRQIVEAYVEFLFPRTPDPR